MPRLWAAVPLCAAALCAVPATAALHQSPTPDHTIDLLTQPTDDEAALRRVSEHEQVWFPAGGGTAVSPTHTPPPAQPLSLRLVGLDRLSYRIGDTFVYEVLITNGGDKPVAVPTSLQQSRFRRQMRDVISALLGLSCDDEMTGLQVFGTQALYGSPEVPGSVIVLRPKETLQLRAPGRWYMTSSFRKAPPKEWILNLWLRADLHLATLPERIPSLSSGNTVSIELGGPTERR